MKFRRLEIDALRMLRAIRQHGGVTRAAEALGVTQSAVSHEVKRLETSLDCDLLARRSGGPMSTAAGDDLLDCGERILGLHDEALLSLTRTGLAGRIRLGPTEGTTLMDPSRILGRFRRLNPQVAARTRVRMSLVLRDLLEREALDAAILQVFDHEVRLTDLILSREALLWVKAPDLEWPEHGPVPLLAFDDACFFGRWALDVGQDGGVLLETVFECPGAAGITTGVASGRSVALLGARHLRSDTQIIRERLPAPPPPSYVVRRARRGRNEALDSLIAEIGVEIGRKGGLSLAV